MDASPAAEGWLLLDADEGRTLRMEVECKGCEEAGLELKDEGEAAMEVEAEERRMRSFQWREKKRRRRRQKRASASSAHYRGKHISLPRDDDEGKRRRKKKKSTCPAELPPLLKSGGRRRRRRPRCCRTPMEVDFSRLGNAFRFVLQPSSLEIGRCFGRCPVRFAPASGHALLQSLMHMQWRKENKEEGTDWKEKKIPSPCCAPARLSDREVMHLSADGAGVEVSTWKRVVVEECACA